MFDNAIDVFYTLIIFIIIAVLVFPLLDALVSSSAKLNSSGLVVYGDFKLSENSIDWGTLFVGENKSVYIDIYDKKYDIQNYIVETIDYDPKEAADYLTLISSYNATCFNFTLCVSPTIQDINEFNFNIVITAI